jgi:hypothetical protein
MIAGLWGEDKSCKSTLALSAPKPIAYMEYDIGGFRRACRNLPHLPIKDWYQQGLIGYQPYVIPFQAGKITATGIIPSRIIVGIKELFYQWLFDFIKLMEDDKQVLAKFKLKEPAATIIIDTGTLLYNTVICDGYLQELQEKQLKPDGTLVDPKDRLRTQLQQQEYREPYDRMRGVVYNAKARGKNLIMTHHATDEFKPMPQKDGSIAMGNTGKRERHGWKQLGDSVDLMVHTYIKEENSKNTEGKVSKVRVPYCMVELAEVQELVGMEFREPTFDQIAQVVQAVRG